MDRYAEMFIAIGNGSRLRIMRLLLLVHSHGMIVGDIQGETGIPSSTLSHHLDRLRNQDLVAARREGTFLWHSVKTDSLRELLAFSLPRSAVRAID